MVRRAFLCVCSGRDVPGKGSSIAVRCRSNGASHDGGPLVRRYGASVGVDQQVQEDVGGCWNRLQWAVVRISS